MSLIKLKNVSKYYYTNGIISSGFSKLNLDFKMGEFIAITGESGSGKSTLLNVISGLDSYEDGEMYINNLETSHYTNKDYEDYRRKYISNIFQNFNLINSYTVYQNIELALLLNGERKKDVKNKILNLIKKVGLSKFKNQKVSKLSGGQKQRVAIARALAKNTPVIIADEPTGSLDTKSANEILKLLSEIAKDKLVIIVTHNYEQIEKYVTRKITMHDGKVIEDKIIKEIENKATIEIDNKQKSILPSNMLRLAIRNTFNVKIKFILLLFVFLFISFAFSIEYSSFKADEQLVSESGYNFYLNNVDTKRIIVKKNDNSVFTDEEIEKIKSNPNVEKIDLNDVLLDNVIELSDYKDIYVSGYVGDIDSFNGKLMVGRMPENENEVVVDAYYYDYYLTEEIDKILNKNLYLSEITTGEKINNIKLKIVGVSYKDENDMSDNTIYMSNKLNDVLYKNFYKGISNHLITIEKNTYNQKNMQQLVMIKTSDKLKKGEVIISDSYNSYCKNYNCKKKNIKIHVENLYYNKQISLKVKDVFNNKNILKLTGYNDYNENSTTIFISSEDYNNLYSNGIYQISIFTKESSLVNAVIDYLKTNDKYNQIAIKDILINDNFVQFIQIFKTMITGILIVVLFFISYFVISIVLKSRKIYFSIIRILGGTKKTCKRLLTLELCTFAILSVSIFTIILLLNNMNLIDIYPLHQISKYMNVKDFVTIYLIIIAMSILLSIKFSKKVFKNTVITSLREDE